MVGPVHAGTCLVRWPDVTSSCRMVIPCRWGTEAGKSRNWTALESRTPRPGFLRCLVAGESWKMLVEVSWVEAMGRQLAS